MIQDAPRTMTVAGLRFLQALASQRKSGCFLEIGPLFGSSTNAIAAGRRDPLIPIHTIDTFEPAPWVVSRLGIELSRSAFEGYTQHIQNLHVHQGFAPDIVKEKWADAIGLYFDDATHGDPGWSNNYSFFSNYFTEDAIICGDDFAGGWPDIVRNVYTLAERAEARLFVVGRVWAFSHLDDTRIADAVNATFPKLAGLELEVYHEKIVHRNIAASWSWGLHKNKPLTKVHFHTTKHFDFTTTITHADGSQSIVDMPKEALLLGGAKNLRFNLPDGFAVQFCIMNQKGKTTNTRDIRSDGELNLAPGESITALRLSHV